MRYSDFKVPAKTLEVFITKGPTLTPTELEAAVPCPAKASKLVWHIVKKLGASVNVIKDGRSVVSYTLVSVKGKPFAKLTATPAVSPVAAVSTNAETSVKTEKVAKTKTVKKASADKSAKIASAIKAKNKKKMAAALKKNSAPRVKATGMPMAEVMTTEMPTAGSNGAIDADFDTTNVDDFLLRA